ncbi:HGxxPAAW family protein [Streptomyces sp. NPDC005474]|uniref:HGxxPAAW family protein n=1 Tax=Streptomyces sp. NPDC005474 TaxID=3154878 RepID=UPI003455325B
MSTYDEGHTVAGWTGTAIATVGSCVLGLGVCMTSVLVVAGGAVVLAAAVLVTWVLHLTGWGKPPGVRPVGDWPMRARDHSARAGHLGCVGCRLAGRGRQAEGVRGTAVAVAAADAVPDRV